VRGSIFDERKKKETKKGQKQLITIPDVLYWVALTLVM
jgi:hypothetical protein